MSRDPIESLQDAPVGEPVAIKGDRLVIRELDVDGTALEAVRAASADGRDPERVVRQMLEVGGAVLLHGAGKATVDAVSAEVDRLMAVLSEKSARLEAVRRIQERLPAKGFSYEDLVSPALDACFAPHHDVVTVTSASKGIADDKVGDFCVTVNPRDAGGRDRRIVFEAKDRGLSMDKALEELDRAMLNRDAQVGVMVFANPSQAPLAGKPMRAFPGNRLMLVWDREEQDSLALEVGCQLARSLALGAEREDRALDRAMLAERVAKLVSAVERAGGVQRGISSARRGLDSAEAAYFDMREEAMAVLLELEERLAE